MSKKKVEWYAVDRYCGQQAIFKVTEEETGAADYIFAPMPFLWYRDDNHFTVNRPHESDEVLWTSFALNKPDFSKFGEPKPEISFDEFFKIINDNMTAQEMLEFGAYKDNPEKYCCYHFVKYSYIDEISFGDENFYGDISVDPEYGVSAVMEETKTGKKVDIDIKAIIKYIKENFELAGHQKDLIDSFL